MRTVALALLCLAGLGLGEEPLSPRESEEALSSLLLAARVAPKKAAPKKVVAAKKVTPKKVAVKKAAPKKVVVKKVVPKKVVVKKVAPAPKPARKKAGVYKRQPLFFTPTSADLKNKGVEFDVRDLGGLTDPKANFLGFGNIDPQGLGYFDPLGFTIGASENKIRSYREAELKHGRIAMLAALGFFVGEQYHPFFDASSPVGEIDGASVYALQKSFELAPQIWLMPLILLISLEMISAVATFRMSKDPLKTFELTSDYTPGDVLAPLGITFDPLNLAPKDPEAFKEMQTKELNNGRVAMIASFLFFLQEQGSGEPVFPL